MKKAPVSVSTQRANSHRGTTSFLPSRQERPPDTYISFALYRAPPALLLSFRFQIAAPESISEKTAPAALHLPAALCTGTLSSYWISFIASLCYYGKLRPVKGAEGKEQETNNSGPQNTLTSNKRPSRTVTAAVSPGSTSLLMPYW